jgi:hypothetical protein
MNRHALAKRRKRITRTHMTNAETNDTAVTGGQQGAHVAPEKAHSKKGATRDTDKSKGQKTAKAAKIKAATPKKSSSAAKKAGSPRAESKSQKILEMTGHAKAPRSTKS